MQDRDTQVAAPQIPTQPDVDLKTLPEVVEIVRTGYWETPYHGTFEITEEDIDEGIAHFNAGVERVNGTEPLPITLDHLGGTSPAAARIYSVFKSFTREGQPIMQGAVTWTALGKEKLERDEYRYISFEYFPHGFDPYVDPEDINNKLYNVLSAATLTNEPLFKRQKPIMASRVPPGRARLTASRGSDESDKRNQGEQMNVEDLRAKGVKDLNDEQKQFLAEHKSELTDDERAKFGLVDAPAETEAPETQAPETEASETQAPAPVDSGAPLEASALKGEVSELRAQLRASREETTALRTKIETKEIDEFLTARVKAGQIKQDQKDSWSKTLLASRGDARTALETQLQELPANESIGKELGDGGQDVQIQASQELHKAVTAKLTASRDAGKHLSYAAAQKEVLASDTALAARVKEEEA